MPARFCDLSLTSAQAACLMALRDGKELKTGIAVKAKLDLIKTENALKTLGCLGLAKQNRKKRWRATKRGSTCRYEILPNRSPRKGGLPGPGGQRLLASLDRPMRAMEISERLGLTHQRVRQLIVKLHAQGHVSFADPAERSSIVMRTGDKNSLSVTRRGARTIGNPARVRHERHKDKARYASAREGPARCP